MSGAGYDVAYTPERLGPPVLFEAIEWAIAEHDAMFDRPLVDVRADT
jgi:hypothetical protein